MQEILNTELNGINLRAIITGLLIGYILFQAALSKVKASTLIPIALVLLLNSLPYSKPAASTIVRSPHDGIIKTIYVEKGENVTLSKNAPLFEITSIDKSKSITTSTPASGSIVRLLKSPGQRVIQGEPILEIYNNSN